MESNQNDVKTSEQQPIIHIAVVGFHHKKGCQVEFSYPPLVEGDDENSGNLPEEWKCLPFLALPDGAHNYDEDTTYFHLPPRSHYAQQTTVYGVSCYRQISTHLLKRKDDDVTRETVQKSVVALSQLPMYGLLHAKLKMITQAYFEEKDFAKNDILKELFLHMNLSIDRMDDSKKYLGLSPRQLVLVFQHKILVLFKLILLERKVLFYTSPVSKLVSSIMSLLSLFPNLVEKGLSQSTVSHKQYSTMLNAKIPKEDTNLSATSRESSDMDLVYLKESVIETNSEFIKKNQEQSNPISSYNERSHTNDSSSSISEVLNNTMQTEGDKNDNTCAEVNHNLSSESKEAESPKLDDNPEATSDDGIVLSTLHNSGFTSARHGSSTIWDSTSEAAVNIAATVTSKFENFSSTLTAAFINEETLNDSHFAAISEIEDDEEEHKLRSSFRNSRLEIKFGSPGKSDSFETITTSTVYPNLSEETVSKEEVLEDADLYFPIDENGFPLSVFTRGYMLLPYVALQQFSELTDNFERGYVIGATNILFKTQSHLADVVVDIENALIEIRDVNLKRQLHLSAADLRFAENIVNNVNLAGDQMGDVFWDATGWEGGDEWIQTQFYEYITSLLSLSTCDNPNLKDVNDFNENFLAAWKRTKNYRVWLANDHKNLEDANHLHPCHAQYSVNDVRLRLHHNLQSSDRGRKLEDAMSTANQAVVNTGKYMGTALVSAKSTVSSWWSSRMKKDSA